MFRSLPRRHHPGGMDVYLHLERRSPPRGVVTAGATSDPLPFSGWLELLRILSQLLSDEPAQLYPAAGAQLGEEVDDMGLHRPAGDEQTRSHLLV